MLINPAMIQEFPIRMECGAYSDPLVLVAARIDEGFNKPSLAQIEFIADTPNINLDDLLGERVTLTFKLPSGPDRVGEGTREREHTGICTGVRLIGTIDGAAHYSAELRPTMWFLSLNQDCRIFQEMTARDIIKEILQDYGVEIDDKLSDTFPNRIICVQYRESDLDFIHRLMEEEGIHYFFTHSGGSVKMVLHDDSTGHSSVPCESEIAFLEKDSSETHRLEHIFEWRKQHTATTGKYTYTDYNFETPNATLQEHKALAKGTHTLRDLEIYDHPGHYRHSGDGERYSRIRMEERAIHYQTWAGAGIVSNLEVGGVMSISGHTATEDSEKFVVRDATHMFRLNDRELGKLAVTRFPDGSMREQLSEQDPYHARFSVIPKDEKFRPEAKTPWPEIAGVHTALVTGPSGEEIHTDEYGRIRIQFHWDRLGAKDEHSTCWVRCMMPWTGKSWGMIAIPRIGQEVVVQFEEGDPDRPLVVGMLYNADTMPPYDLPANKTQSGIKTRSSKEGTSSNFNELRFEDKKGAEEVYFHAEKDFNQVVENDATVTIGFDDKDKGDLTQKVYHDKTEEIGNDSTIKIGYGEGGKSPGDLVHEVFNDRTEKIGNHFTTTVEKGNHEMEVSMGDQTNTVKMGNQENTVSMGNLKNTVKMGNFTEEISMGNHTTKVNLGKTEHTAMQSIEFKVGANSIKIDQMGVTIKGIMVKIEGTAMLDAKAPMTTVKGDGMLILKGGIMMIN
ncbi:type VI secretion system tip protein TssI/VgrG [Tropicimonas sp. TH_r6]|uniref:type VI secretion system Vgr family protein n=1 Tax=Tropicimonas sp. TH_r6 TaxID=3082085 RepID=UPI0029556D50|nr:type VI secretion system tip protein TssI/VgrG [Tropicimonas sp. TH_r6]MDV7143093.1 type VI secretion system tip protein TssI/VgrG [Tropicimonas sp. TH_r6]